MPSGLRCAACIAIMRKLYFTLTVVNFTLE
jgi:hypothetical protein